jgi:hypothetical protein
MKIKATGEVAQPQSRSEEMVWVNRESSYREMGVWKTEE